MAVKRVEAGSGESKTDEDSSDGEIDADEVAGKAALKDAAEDTAEAIAGKAIVGSNAPQVEGKIAQAIEKILFRSAGAFWEHQGQAQLKLIAAEGKGFTHKAA